MKLKQLHEATLIKGSKPLNDEEIEALLAQLEQDVDYIVEKAKEGFLSHKECYELWDAAYDPIERSNLQYQGWPEWARQRRWAIEDKFKQAADLCSKRDRIVQARRHSPRHY